MYTQCPRCETIFRVTAEILRAAAGQVRCGRCGAAFSALAHLEERPDDFPLAGSRLDQDRRAERILESAPGTDDPGDRSDDFAASEPGETVFGEQIERLRIVGPPFFPEEESLEFTVPPGDLDRVFVAPEHVATPRWSASPESTGPAAAEPDATASADVEFEEIVLEATLEPADAGEFDPPIDTAPQDAATTAPETAADADATVASPTALEPEPEPEAESESESESEPAIEPVAMFTDEAMRATEARTESQAATDPGSDTDPGSSRGSAAAADAALLAAATDAETPALPLERPRHRLATVLWSTLAVFLVLLLGAQIVNREREFIASHTPFGEPLRALYARLGLRLPIPADLHDYQLRQWGVTSDPAANGILRVRASILNTAAAFQPYPWLRVTLTDRFGNRVGTRDFAPREYLGKPPQLMAPGQRANATLSIVDPGKNAEGFEIDLCLRGDSGAMVCDTGGS